MWRFARAHGIASEIKRLHRPAVTRALLAVAVDWAMIFAAFAAVTAWQLRALPFAVVVIGNRQRALGNLLHDAAHGSFGRRRRIADQIALWLLFRPMWTSLECYRREHFAHHRFLGVPRADVDLLHRDDDMGRFWLSLLCKHVTNRHAWTASAFGHLARAGQRELGWMLGWWGGLLLALAMLLTPEAALEFAGLWLLSRATSFHLITTFREISDHVGLRPGTVLGFSRNHACRGWLGALFHPHHNGYHLAHHLNPGMPHYALPRVHALLLQWPDYAAAAHCRRYFFGEGAAVASWMRSASAAAGAAVPSVGGGRL
jgi:fatty acid desaturase